jgi:hypothetical protein
MGDDQFEPRETFDKVVQVLDGDTPFAGIVVAHRFVKVEQQGHIHLDGGGGHGQEFGELVMSVNIDDHIIPTHTQFSRSFMVSPAIGERCVCH